MKENKKNQPVFGTAVNTDKKQVSKVPKYFVSLCSTSIKKIPPP